MNRETLLPESVNIVNWVIEMTLVKALSVIIA